MAQNPRPTRPVLKKTTRTRPPSRLSLTGKVGGRSPAPPKVRPPTHGQFSKISYTQSYLVATLPMHLLTKPLALASLLLLVTSARAADPAAAIVNLKAPQAIELVSQQAAESKANPAQPALTLLDVRTPEEFTSGHLAGDQKHAKPRDLMTKLGFTRIYHLDGGLTAWKAAGGQVVKTDPAPANP